LFLKYILYTVCMNEEIKYLNAFNQFELIGPKTLGRIKKYFGSYKKAWDSPADVFKNAGLKGKVLENLRERHKIDPDKQMERLEKYKIKILTKDDKAYPKLLAEIYDPPEILYYLGSPEAFSEFSLAIVGTRRYTPYGKEVVEYFASDLAQMQLTIVSGLALGIDALAHRATVEAGGITIGVLGCGLDQIYPVCNKKLGQDILKTGGAIVSEYPLGSPPLKHHFPVRNRIISGLSLGVLVIEANEKSGTLLTANHALEQNREVFAVPGNIFSARSRGSHFLIKSGAKLVSEPRDILTELEIKDVKAYKEIKKIIGDTPEEEKIIELISETPMEVDKIIKNMNLGAPEVNSLLTIMEMKGKIKNLGTGLYTLKR